jgi:hypothetical protein
MTSLRRTVSCDASWRPLAPTLHVLAYSFGRPCRRHFRKLVQAYLPAGELVTISAGSSAAPPAEMSTSPTNSESERQPFDSDATIHLTCDYPAGLPPVPIPCSGPPPHGHHPGTNPTRCCRQTARKYARTFSSERFASILPTRLEACCGGSWDTPTQPYATQRYAVHSLEYAELS